MVVVAEDRPAHDGDPIYRLGDNTTTVDWVNRCGGAKITEAAALMRVLGVLESKEGMVPSGVSHYRYRQCDSRWYLTVAAQRTPICKKRWQEANMGTQGASILFGGLAWILSRVGIAPWSLATYGVGFEL